MVPDVPGSLPSSWAMPCLPVAGIKMGMFTVPPIGAGRVDRVRAGRPRLSRSGSAATGAARPRCRRSRARCRPASAGITLQTTLKNGIVISDVPGPTGGILIQTTTGAMISVSDSGIIISNGKGAIINMTGPTVDVNHGALTVI